MQRMRKWVIIITTIAVVRHSSRLLPESGMTVGSGIRRGVSGKDVWVVMLEV